MKKLPRIFCLTLKETPLRTKGFLEVASAAKLDVTMFYGVLGSRLGLVPKLPNEIESPGQNIMMTERGVGCNLSHLMLWKHLSFLPDEEFLVFEDDAIIPSDFLERFQSLYDKLPEDWQMAYVGWIKYGKDVPPILIDDGITIRIPSVTHAYLIKKSVLEDLCNALMPVQSNIDLTLVNRLLPKIRYYVFDPSLVSQRSYLNTTDPVWTSLVYDWQNDLYGCKKDILQHLELKEGWHTTEQDGKNFWKWSKDSFSLKVPPNLDSISLECSTPIENVLELARGEDSLRIPLKVGDNLLTIISKGSDELSFSMKESFVPSEKNPKSKDTRVLGICLKRLILTMGTTSIPIEASQLGSSGPPPMTFKL